MGLAQDMKIIKDAGLDIELLERANDKLCAKNNEEIAELEEKITSQEFIIEKELKASKEDKLECKFDGYKGSMGWQKMPDKWTYIDEVLMAFIISLPKRLKNLFLKTTITIKKANIKKQIIEDNTRDFENGKIFDFSPGMKLYLVGENGDYLVKGIEIETQESKFKYSIKKIKK